MFRLWCFANGGSMYTKDYSTEEEAHIAAARILNTGTVDCTDFTEKHFAVYRVSMDNMCRWSCMVTDLRVHAHETGSVESRIASVKYELARLEARRGKLSSMLETLRKQI